VAVVPVTGNAILKYFVLPDTGGPFACGDSLFATGTGNVRSGDLEKDITTALNSLFSTGVKYIGDLYNPLYQSNLRVSKLEIIKGSGDVTAYLTGNFVKPKNDCDKARYRAQVWQTVLQFPEVSRFHAWVNNRSKLGDLLANDN
jgi:hypothetical protein